MHKNFAEHKYFLTIRLHLWLSSLSCVIIMIAPIIRFSTSLGLIVDAVGMALLITCVFLQGSVRPIQHLDRMMIAMFSYFLALVILSAIFVGTEMAFEKALGVFIGGCIFYVAIFAFNEALNVRIFCITVILLTFIFTALSFQKGIEAIVEMRLLFSFACPIAIFSIYILLLTAKWWQSFLLLGLLIQFIYWGTETANRGLFIITILIVSFHYIFIHKKSWKAKLMLLPTIAAFVSAYWYFFFDSAMMFRILSSSEAGSGREDIWAYSLSGIIETFPTGAGINESYRYLPSGFFWSHNIILELFLEFGIFSIPIIFALLAIIFLGLHSKRKEQIFFLMVFLICLLNFMKSFSLSDVRLLTLPMALLIIAMRKKPNLDLN